MGALPAAVALALVVVAQASRADAVRPHIVFLMADDLGHGNVGWHRRGPDAVPEANTPAMDALVAEGVALERVYSYACCSPTRSSFISGRLPIHVNVLNTDPATFNSSSGEGAGVATHMTGIGEVLARANYTTAVVGKWDVGMATPHHTPAGRGFQQSLIYFHHCNSYWTSTVGSQTDRHCSPDGAMIDLWTNEGAAPPHPPGVYQERMFVDKAQDIMTTYAANATARAAGPLFLFYASHTVHTPMEVPQANLDRFLGIKELSLTGQGYAALVSVLDEVVANLTASLKTTGLWENTLLVFQSDNGGPIYDNTAKNWHNLSTPQCPSVVRPGMTGPDGREPYRSTCLDFGGAASNYPLRGGKFSNFEGGVRVASFMSGGFIAAGMRGTTSHALIATADWLMTFASLAGVDAKDARAEEYGLPPIDSVDQSGVILGTAAAGLSLREDLVLGGVLVKGGSSNPRAIISSKVGGGGGGGRATLFKLLLGSVPFATWSGVRYPNASSGALDPRSITQNCSEGCLFEVMSDPTEHVEISAQHPEVVTELKARLEAVEATAWVPNRGVPMEAACDRKRYDGHYGPFLHLDDDGGGGGGDTAAL